MFTLFLLPYLIFGLGNWNIGTAAVPAYQSHELLASRALNMNLRYPNSVVNDVFAKNILLAILFIREDGKRENISMEKAVLPFTYSFDLQPGETFTFHDSLLAEYKTAKIVKSTHSTFGYSDGYVSSGSLYGDGVCHLASLMKWAAVDAVLEVVAPANHNFRAIPEIPAEHGVSIFYDPANPANSAHQNLYITNNREKTITFVFVYDGTILKVNIMSKN